MAITLKRSCIIALVALLALAGAGPARAGWILTPTGWVEQTGTTDGATNVNALLTNPNVTNYAPQALGPTTHRENNGGAPWVATYVRDTTAAIALLGGTKVGLWFNVVPDTANAESLGVVHWYALGVRMNLTQAVDSTVSSPWQPLMPAAAIGGLTNVVASYFPQGSLAAPTALTPTPNVALTLLAGEILVPLQVTNSGIGGSRFVTIDLGGAALVAEFVSFTLRSFGHWSNSPQASFIRLPTYKTKVRMDVVVLK